MEFLKNEVIIGCSLETNVILQWEKVNAIDSICLGEVFSNLVYLLTNVIKASVHEYMKVSHYFILFNPFLHLIW